MHRRRRRSRPRRSPTTRTEDDRGRRRRGDGDDGLDADLATASIDARSTIASGETSVERRRADPSPQADRARRRLARAPRSAGRVHGRDAALPAAHARGGARARGAARRARRHRRGAQADRGEPAPRRQDRATSTAARTGTCSTSCRRATSASSRRSAKFDPYRGVKLSSYAAFWIRAYILKFILNNWRLVKIGTTQAQRKLFFNLRKEREKLEQLGFQPTTALLAEKLDVPEKEVIEMERRLAAPEASLDAPLGGGDDERRAHAARLPAERRRPPRSRGRAERVRAAAARQARGVRADARGPRADDLPRALADRGAADAAGDRRSLPASAASARASSRSACSTG